MIRHGHGRQSGWRAVVIAWCAAVASGAEPQPVPGDVDLANSRVYVFVGKSGLGHDHAVIGSLQAGRIELGAPERAGLIVFNMRSFLADTADARRVLGLPGETAPDTQQQVTDNMLGPAVLDVNRHPTAAFELSSALPAAQPAPNGRPCYDLVGSFTLHGVTRPVSLRVEAEPVGPLVRLSGGFTIKQTDFGMKPFAKFGGVVGVADELRIYGDIRLLAAGRSPPPPAPAQPPTSLSTTPR